MAANAQIRICSPMTTEAGAFLFALHSIGPKGRRGEAAALSNELPGGQRASGLPLYKGCLEVAAAVFAVLFRPVARLLSPEHQQLLGLSTCRKHGKVHLPLLQTELC